MVQTQAPALSLALDHEAFPCGAALQVVRSPRASAAPPLVHCSSAASSGSLSSGPTVDGDDSSTGDNNEDADTTRCTQQPKQQSATPNKAAPDLARRSQQRVSDRKRTELERREEEEQRRRARTERDRQERDQAARVKMCRRAEIYALNAILRDLQQRKIAEYIEAQRARQQQQAEGGGEQTAGASEAALCSAVQAIGV